MSHLKINHSQSPLDMGQFNTITEGKSSNQTELLKIFFSNSAECLEIMERNSANDMGLKAWQCALAELRDIASSIGALELSKVCAVAEKVGIESEGERKKMLVSVKLHLQRLRSFTSNNR